MSVSALVAAALAAQASAVAVDQIQALAPANVAAPQLPKEPRNVRPVEAQRAARDATAPASSSGRADSRPRASARLPGADLCDPAAARGKTAPICQKVIESRADEFAPPAPRARSPESELVRRRTVRPAEDAAGAARQLGRGEITEGAVEAALGQARPAEPDPTDPATDAGQAVLGRPGAPVIQLPPGR